MSRETTSETEMEPMSEEKEIIEAEAVIETTETVDLPAEVEKWKSLSRKNEQQAKTNAQAARELEELKRSQLSDTEKLIESTKDETRKAMRIEFAQKLVDSELKAALNGKSLDGKALFEFNKSSFVDSNGDVDSASITEWVEAHSITHAQNSPDLGQGLRGKKSGSTLIRSREELKSMSPAEILAARSDGRLDALLGKL